MKIDLKDEFKMLVTHVHFVYYYSNQKVAGSTPDEVNF
jgi:hypothetical protein